MKKALLIALAGLLAACGTPAVSSALIQEAVRVCEANGGFVVILSPEFSTFPEKHNKGTVHCKNGARFNLYLKLEQKDK